ncbi:hypothetical protein KPL70_013931 [Citrus sinensis]|nr:hypothetical protein KPL70_013931 [Citrus sinensis]
MNQRLCCLIVLFLSVVPLLAAGDRKGALVGGWKPIEDPKEKHVMEIGQFAVTEYNKRSKSALKFESVEKGETQVVSGTNYRLILVVKDGPSTKKFEAVVWEKPWEHFKSLTSFKPFKPMVGGWKPIEDPKEKHVMEIGQFAVTEYNKRSKSALKFESVEKGETQVVSGTNYRLILVVKDGPSTKKFEAVVWEKPWEHFKSLTSFKPFKPMVGGWKPIEDPKEKHVMEIGQFAVTEYNKRSKSALKFESVEKGETQVVSGTNYWLILVVKDGPSTKKFEAVVWEKPWEHFKSLTSFKPFKPMVGGWKPIEDPKEKHVMEIGQFAVTEYNKRSKSALKFESVEKGETQVVSGTNYRLILVVKDGPSTKKFEAVVWEKPWEHFKSLTSFKPFKPMVGGWKPIEDPKEKHVMEIGQFAVTEYNKRSKSALKFESVEKGETQVVSGTNYRLILVVKDGPSTKKFEAVVWEKPWEHFKSLTSFKPFKPMVGGWKPIEDPKEKHVMEIGQFAVTEYNKRSKSALKFESVEKGETQVVSGTNYRLILVVKDGPSTKKFEAVVWEKPWEHSKSLTSFKPFKPMVGGWKPIEDPKEKHVMEIGQFAVTEYNKRSKSALKFESVEKGETQVVSGTNYRLILVVKDGPSTKKFEAVVLEKPWEHFKSLTSFKPFKPMVGGWKPIEDPKEKHVMEIGQFAVTEYNKRSKSALKFESVEKGETQVVSGTNYWLILVVKDGPSTKKFEAVVWEKPWEHFKSLTSFKPFKPMVGGWKPIEDPKEKHVMEIGQFAVMEYNKRSKSALKFESVEKGETQVVSGTNYRLILVVKDGPSTKKFEAVVLEKPWEHFKSLTSFKPMVKYGV